MVGGIKTRKPGHLAREVLAVRDHHRFRGEFKFSELTRRTVAFYRDVIDVIQGSDAHIKAFVIDKTIRDPFSGVPQWDAQASMAAQLLAGSINRDELAVAMMDNVSTPVGVSLEEIVRDKVHDKLDGLGLVSCVALDSKCTDGLQIADLVVGAVAYDRKSHEHGAGDPGVNPSTPKAQVHRMLCAAFGLPDLSDVREGRASILTSRPGRRSLREQRAKGLMAALK